jgi:tRNA-dihydrouridine synthase 3
VRPSINECTKETDQDKIDKNDNLDNEPEKKKLKENFKKNKPRGQNKGRKLPFKTLREHNLCPWIANLTAEEATENNKCPNDICTFIHDRIKYLEIKPEDVGADCHIFKSTGKCQRGASCRFGSKHTTSDGFNIVDKEKYEAYQSMSPQVKNLISKDIIEKLKKYKYNFAKAEKIGSTFNWVLV